MNHLHIEKNNGRVQIVDMDQLADWYWLEIQFDAQTFTEMRVVASSNRAKKAFEIFYLSRHGFGPVEIEGDFELFQEGDQIWKKGGFNTYVFMSPSHFEKV